MSEFSTAESLVATAEGGGRKRAVDAPEARANARLIASAATDLAKATADEAFRVLADAVGEPK